MKIILFLHELALGGTTVNAIELAAALRDSHGHDVVLFAPPGPMLDLVRHAGLRFLAAPRGAMHPCPSRMKALRAAVREEQPDLLYVWETWALVDAYYAVHVPMQLPLLLTDMQMHVTRLLPRSIPTTFGTPELVDIARARGVRRVDLLLPPVDLRHNAPGLIDPKQARARYGVEDGEIALVIVSRLVHSMKGESLLHAIDAVAALGPSQPRMRLLIVGDGSARHELEKRAEAVNATLGRRAVVMLGALLDPRFAYAAADVVIGMGGSALRGMAFGKPVIVVGESGFAAALTPETADQFHYKGIFGKGEGPADGSRLLSAIRDLAGSSERRRTLGAFSLEFARRSFSLDVVAGQLNDACRATAESRPRRGRIFADSVRTAAIYLRERRFLWRSPPEPVTVVDASARATGKSSAGTA